MTALTEEQVRQLIERIYCYKYVGRIRITELHTAEGGLRGYLIDFGLNRDERPLSIAIDGTAEDCLKYLEKDLRQRRLHYDKYYFGEKLR